MDWSLDVLRGSRFGGDQMKNDQWNDRRDKYDHVFRPIYDTVQEQLAGMIAQLEQALSQRIRKQDFDFFFHAFPGGPKTIIVDQQLIAQAINDEEFIQERARICKALRPFMPAIAQVYRAAFDLKHYVHSGHLAMLLRVTCRLWSCGDSVGFETVKHAVGQMVDNVIPFSNQAHLTRRIIYCVEAPKWDAYIARLVLDLANSICPTPDTPEELVKDACRKACEDLSGKVIYFFVDNGQKHPVLAEGMMKEP